MSKDETCTRCVIHEYGGVEQLRIESGQALPIPARGQVRVRVEASSVQFTDTIIRRGRYPGVGKPPLTLGYDLVGRIDALGPGSDGWSIGDRVADLTTVGANATHALCASAGLVRVPEGLDPAVATALVLSGVTAYQMLFRHVQVGAGTRVLIQGGNGGVGRFAIQLAREAGAKVWTTARPKHHDEMRALGADPIDYSNPEYPAELRARSDGGMDLVFDGQGADRFRPSLRTLRRSGRLVTIGAGDAVTRGGGMTFSVVSALARNVMPFGPCVSFYSITTQRKKQPKQFGVDLALLFDKALNGKLDVQIERRIGFAQIAQAHADLERGGVSGKIVLLPSHGAPP